MLRMRLVVEFRLIKLFQTLAARETGTCKEDCRAWAVRRLAAEDRSVSDGYIVLDELRTMRLPSGFDHLTDECRDFERNPRSCWLPVQFGDDRCDAISSRCPNNDADDSNLGMLTSCEVGTEHTCEHGSL